MRTHPSLRQCSPITPSLALPRLSDSLIADLLHTFDVPGAHGARSLLSNRGGTYGAHAEMSTRLHHHFGPVILAFTADGPTSHGCRRATETTSNGGAGRNVSDTPHTLSTGGTTSLHSDTCHKLGPPHRFSPREAVAFRLIAGPLVGLGRINGLNTRHGRGRTRSSDRLVPPVCCWTRCKMRS